MRNGISSRKPPLGVRETLSFGGLFAYYETMRLLKQGKRKCCVCGVVRSLDADNFYRSRNRAGGFDSRCKICEKTRTREKTKYQRAYRLRTRGDKTYEGYIYIIKSQDYYKIGSTKHKVFNKRMETLQTGNPYKLEIIKVIPADDMYYTESKLHERFRDKWYRGERFLLNQGDIDSI